MSILGPVIFGIVVGLAAAVALGRPPKFPPYSRFTQ